MVTLLRTLYTSRQIADDFERAFTGLPTRYFYSPQVPVGSIFRQHMTNGDLIVWSNLETWPDAAAVPD